MGLASGFLVTQTKKRMKIIRFFCKDLLSEYFRIFYGSIF